MIIITKPQTKDLMRISRASPPLRVKQPIGETPPTTHCTQSCQSVTCILQYLLHVTHQDARAPTVTTEVFLTFKVVI